MKTKEEVTQEFTVSILPSLKLIFGNDIHFSLITDRKYNDYLESLYETNEITLSQLYEYRKTQYI